MIFLFFCHARINGLWDKILEHLVKKAQTNVGSKENPSNAIMDPQSVKMVAASEERGIDGGKNERQKVGVATQI